MTIISFIIVKILNEMYNLKRGMHVVHIVCFQKKLKTY